MAATKSAKKNSTYRARTINKVDSPRNSPAPETPQSISIKGSAPTIPESSYIELDMNGSGKRERIIENDGEPKKRRKPRKPKPPKVMNFETDKPATFLEKIDLEDDFNSLFMMDSTPSAVPIESAYINASLQSPTKPSETTEAIELQEKLTKEEEEMRIFAEEVAMDGASDEEEDDVEEEDEEEFGKAEVVEMKIYDDPKKLEEAIQGKITDDSAAKVTGRYYKEVDLTRSCALCGEQGHTSRECTHSQCFTCGEVDGDHEARYCPVTLVCLSCGSRGHVSRECTVSGGSRNSYGARCALCSSGLHAASNCPSLWRVYNVTGAQPKKTKLIYACANDGSTNDHFIDDCLLPRMHPIRSCDPSAFNAAAAGQKVNSRRPANGGADAERRRNAERMEQEADDETDWFASHSTADKRNKNTSNRGGNSARKPDRFNSNSRDSPSNNSRGGKSDHNMSYQGGGRFSSSNSKKSRDSPTSSRDEYSANSRQRQRSPPTHSRGSELNYFPEESKYRGSAASNRSGGGSNSRNRDDRRGGGHNDSRYDEGTPSLQSRIGSSRRGPSYQGGYY